MRIPKRRTKKSIHLSFRHLPRLAATQATVAMPQTSRFTHQSRWLKSSVVASQTAIGTPETSEMRAFTTMRHHASWWNCWLLVLPSFSGQILNKPLETDCRVYAEQRRASLPWQQQQPAQTSSWKEACPVSSILITPTPALCGVGRSLPSPDTNSLHNPQAAQARRSTPKRFSPSRLLIFTLINHPRSLLNIVWE